MSVQQDRLSREFIKRTRQFGDIVVTYQWVNEEPAMCLLRRAFEQKNAYVICLSSAYKYIDDKYLVSASMKAAQILGFEESKMAAFKIADVIMNGLEELIRMEPEPDAHNALFNGAAPTVEFDQRTNKIVLH